LDWADGPEESANGPMPPYIDPKIAAMQLPQTSH
jgi:hypothetical protein